MATVGQANQQSIHKAAAPSIFEGAERLHNTYTKWLDSNTLTGIYKTFGIRTEGENSDATVSKIMKFVSIFFASVLLLPLALIGQVVDIGKNLLCGKPIAATHEPQAPPAETLVAQAAQSALNNQPVERANDQQQQQPVERANDQQIQTLDVVGESV